MEAAMQMILEAVRAALGVIFALAVAAVIRSRVQRWTIAGALERG